MHCKIGEKVRRGEDEKPGENDNGACMEEGQREKHCTRKATKELGRI